MTATLEAAAVPIADAIVGAAVGVVVRGGGTHQDVGNPARSGCDVITVPSGVVAYDPDDMTVTVRAGTSVAELRATLAAHGQEVPLDPVDDAATVGGVLACGLSGPRRLRLGPVRDTVLEVRFVDGTGTLIKGGGPVVKNVTGYDLPRLLVGSLGTLGVIVQTTLRCRPVAAASQWFATADDPFAVRDRLFRPCAVVTDGASSWVLVEGYPDDLDEEARRAGLDPSAAGSTPFADTPWWREGQHRGRVSVPPGRLAVVVASLRELDGVQFFAELGVGTVHIGSHDPDGLVAARAVAEAHDGWMLRERGGPSSFDGFGVAVPNTALQQRVKRAFDPDDKLAPGRLPS